VSAADKEARRLVERAVQLAPSSAETNYARAFVLSLTGEAEEAVVVARRATELNPSFAEAYAVLGQALLFAGDVEGALAACRQAERSNPRDLRGSWLHDIVGHVHFFLGDYNKAIEETWRSSRCALDRRACELLRRPPGRPDDGLACNVLNGGRRVGLGGASSGGDQVAPDQGANQQGGAAA